MSIMMTAFHITDGPREMFPVDLQQAVGNHPEEWSRIPWTDETRDAALPKLREKRQRQQDALKADRKTQAGVSLVDGAYVPGAKVRHDDEERALRIKALEEDAGFKTIERDDAQKALDVAKQKGNEKEIAKAQAAYDEIATAHAEAQAKVDVAKKG